MLREVEAIAIDLEGAAAIDGHRPHQRIGIPRDDLRRERRHGRLRLQVHQLAQPLRAGRKRVFLLQPHLELGDALPKRLVFDSRVPKRDVVSPEGTRPVHHRRRRELHA